MHNSSANVESILVKTDEQGPGQHLIKYCETMKRLVSVLESSGGWVNDPAGARSKFMRKRYLSTLPTCNVLKTCIPSCRMFQPGPRQVTKDTDRGAPNCYFTTRRNTSQGVLNIHTRNATVVTRAAAADIAVVGAVQFTVEALLQVAFNMT
jgi:hypothetical protein